MGLDMRYSKDHRRYIYILATYGFPEKNLRWTCNRSTIHGSTVHKCTVLWNIAFTLLSCRTAPQIMLQNSFEGEM